MAYVVQVKAGNHWVNTGDEIETIEGLYRRWKGIIETFGSRDKSIGFRLQSMVLEYRAVIAGTDKIPMFSKEEFEKANLEARLHPTS